MFQNKEKLGSFLRRPWRGFINNLARKSKWTSWWIEGWENNTKLFSERLSGRKFFTQIITSIKCSKIKEEAGPIQHNWQIPETFNKGFTSIFYFDSIFQVKTKVNPIQDGLFLCCSRIGGWAFLAPSP